MTEKVFSSRDWEALADSLSTEVDVLYKDQLWKEKILKDVVVEIRKRIKKRIKKESQKMKGTFYEKRTRT